MNTIAIIEARMGSSRLPGKVLLPINKGKPALEVMVDRIKLSNFVDDIVVATSENKLDDELYDYLKKKNINVFRGSEDDVLGRVVGAAELMNADIIVELTGDCILSDPEIIDLGIETFLYNDCDIVSNCGTHLTYPMGIYVQVFKYSDLKNISDTIFDSAVREHVSLYYYENTDKYRLINLVASTKHKGPDIRTQLDYPEDLEFLNQVFQELEPDHGIKFGLDDIMKLLHNKPELLDINKHCIEKSAR